MWKSQFSSGRRKMAPFSSPSGETRNMRLGILPVLNAQTLNILRRRVARASKEQLFSSPRCLNRGWLNRLAWLRALTRAQQRVDYRQYKAGVLSQQSVSMESQLRLEFP